MSNVFLSFEVRQILIQVKNAVEAIRNEQVEPSLRGVTDLGLLELPREAAGLLGRLETQLGNASDLLSELTTKLDRLLATDDGVPPTSDGRLETAAVAEQV